MAKKSNKADSNKLLLVLKDDKNYQVGLVNLAQILESPTPPPRPELFLQYDSKSAMRKNILKDLYELIRYNPEIELEKLIPYIGKLRYRDLLKYKNSSKNNIYWSRKVTADFIYVYLAIFTSKQRYKYKYRIPNYGTRSLKTSLYTVMDALKQNPIAIPPSQMGLEVGFFLTKPEKELLKSKFQKLTILTPADERYSSLYIPLINECLKTGIDMVM